MSGKKEDNIKEIKEEKKEPKKFINLKHEHKKENEPHKKFDKHIDYESEQKPNDKDKQIEELTGMLKRIQAEFINFKNRTERENKEMYEYSSADLIKKLLPVLDSFELAFKNTKDHEMFKKGLEMVYAQLLDVLSHEGLRKIDVEGKKFDPYKHEVLMKGKSQKDPDMVIEEFQRGYMLKDKVVRHSKVKVSE
ncbi:MAG: nucleotide exchange factor GrpE [Nanoarchaeota archaeon]